MSILELLLNDKVAAAFLGLIGGAIATFIAPWISWGVERKKLQYQARKETIARWRTMVVRVSNENKSDDDFGNTLLALYEDNDFLSLMPYISKDTQSVLDSAAMNYEVFEALLADISVMEKKWKIL